MNDAHDCSQQTLSRQSTFPMHSCRVISKSRCSVISPPGSWMHPSPTLCAISKSLYGLKQTPRAWFTRFASFVAPIGFVPTRSDSSLFIYRHGEHLMYLLLYVDDIILTASSTPLLQATISIKIKDMGSLKSFLGVEIR
jgi:hypothetical protein